MYEVARFLAKSPSSTSYVAAIVRLAMLISTNVAVAAVILCNKHVSVESVTMKEGEN